MANLSRAQRAAGAVEILTKARSFLLDPKRWIKGSLYDLKSHGAEDAVKACSIGAVRVAASRAPKIELFASYERKNTAENTAEEALQAVSARINDGLSVEGFNDHRKTTHADVLAMFDLAIEEQCKIVQREAAEDPNAEREGS